MLATGPRGLADHDPTVLGEQVLACWDAFLDVASASGTDLSRPSRLPGWSGRDVCVHVGAFDGTSPMEGILDSARRGDLADLGSPDAGNEAKVRAHRGLSDDEVLAGVVRARDAVEAFFDGPDLAAHGRTSVVPRWARSPCCRWCTPPPTSSPSTAWTWPRAAPPRRRRCCWTAVWPPWST